MNGLLCSPCRGRKRSTCAPVCRPVGCSPWGGSLLAGLTAACLSWSASCRCVDWPCFPGNPCLPEEDCRPQMPPCPPCPPPEPQCWTRSLRSLLDMPSRYCLLQAQIIPCRCFCQNGQVCVEYETRVCYRDCSCEERLICRRQTVCFDDISLSPGRLTIQPCGCAMVCQGRCHLSIEQKIEICNESLCGD